MDKTKKGWVITTVSVLFACGLLYFLAAEYPGWGNSANEEKFLSQVWDKNPWTNEPADLNKAGGNEVMLKLLELDRGEIQYWEEKLFTVSFWANTAILAIVSFVLQKKPPTTMLRWVCAIGCVVLCIFYLIFVDFAEKAMVANDHDLRGIQYALKLSTPNQYLLHEQVIYKEAKDEKTGHPIYGLIGHVHIKYLVRFNVLLVIFSVILLLVLLPLEQVQRGRRAKETE